MLLLEKLAEPYVKGLLLLERKAPRYLQHQENQEIFMDATMTSFVS